MTIPSDLDLEDFGARDSRFIPRLLGTPPASAVSGHGGISFLLSPPTLPLSLGIAWDAKGKETFALRETLL